MADKPPFIESWQPSTVFDKSKAYLTPTTPVQLRDNCSYFSLNSPFTPGQSPVDTMISDSASPGAMGPPTTKGTKKLDITSLMSPPDPVLDSFSQGSDRNSRRDNAGNDEKQPLPMSPPISPYTSTTDAPTTPPGQSIQDPVLYPAEEGVPTSPAQPPLFALAELDEHRSLVDDHVRSRASSFSQVAPPKREDYALVLHFQSQIAKLYSANPRAWLRRERAILLADRAQAQWRNVVPAAAKPPAGKPQRSHRTTDRVSKPVAAPRPVRTHPSPPSSAAVVARPAVRRVSATPEPRRQAAPNREDKDFESLPNYCPPNDSLPMRANSLKVDWKGQPIDLSRDKDAHLLHPDELILAGNLRLDCATYLTSKRRIFERRLQCLRNKKEFRKTDAQQACKIDVNKASKLWTAFDKVGWLDPSWMYKFL